MDEVAAGIGDVGDDAGHEIEGIEAVTLLFYAFLLWLVFHLFVSFTKNPRCRRNLEPHTRSIAKPCHGGFQGDPTRKEILLDSLRRRD